MDGPVAGSVMGQGSTLSQQGGGGVVVWAGGAKNEDQQRINSKTYY